MFYENGNVKCGVSDSGSDNNDPASSSTTGTTTSSLTIAGNTSSSSRDASENGSVNGNDGKLPVRAPVVGKKRTYSEAGITSSPSRGTSEMNENMIGDETHDPLGLLQQSSYFASATIAMNKHASNSGSGRMNKRLTMTEEERRQHRLESNRRSATASRNRQKILLVNLKDSVDRLSDENLQLKLENKCLKDELNEQRGLIHTLLQMRSNSTRSIIGNSVTNNQHITSSASLNSNPLLGNTSIGVDDQGSIASLLARVNAQAQVAQHNLNSLQSIQNTAATNNPSHLLIGAAISSPSGTNLNHTSVGTTPQKHVLNADNVRRLQLLLHENAAANGQSSSALRISNLFRSGSGI